MSRLDGVRTVNLCTGSPLSMPMIESVHHHTSQHRSCMPCLAGLVHQPSDMRVVPDHRRGTRPSKAAPNACFSDVGFGMDVDGVDVLRRLQGTHRHFALDSLKKIVERFHATPPLRVQNQHICAISLKSTRSAARRAFREIQRPEKAFSRR